MISPKSILVKNPPRVWSLLGIPVLIVFGSIMHFIYEWSGNSTAVGILAPVNESVWEHLKLTFWPIIIWWLIGYLICKNQDKGFFTRWIFSCAIAGIICPIVILSFFYTYTSAFGIESLILDILSMILGIIAGQVLGLHIFQHARLGYHWLYMAVAIAILVILAAAFTVFTFEPSHLPIFMDSSTGKYGINKV